MNPNYRSSGVRFVINTSLYIAIMAPVFSICLMGSKWAYLFGVVALPALPVIFLTGFFISRFDSFSLDDEKRQIIKGRRRIPYDAIMRIDLNRTGSLLHVSVKVGRFRRTPLAYALERSTLLNLKEELCRRFPQTIIREKWGVDWKSIFIIFLVVVTMTALFHVFLYRNKPELRAVPEQVRWEATKGVTKKFRLYSAENFLIAAPERFQLVGKDIAALEFEDRATKETIKAVAITPLDTAAPKMVFISYVSGIKSYYELLETGYSAKFGIVPLMIKMMAFEGFRNVTIREVLLTSPAFATEKKKGSVKEKEQEMYPELKAFVLQGEKNGKANAFVYLTDSNEKTGMQIVVSGPLAKDEKSLRTILTSVRLLRSK